MDDMEDGELPPSPSLDEDVASNDAIDAPYTPLLRPETVKSVTMSITRPRSATNSSTVANMGDLSDFDDVARICDPSASGSSSPKTGVNCATEDDETPASRILRGLPGSESDEDSDSDNGSTGRPIRKMRRSNDSIIDKESNGGDAFRMMATQFQQSRVTSFSPQQQQQHLKKKANNVWNMVLTEETLTSDLTGIGVGRRSQKEFGSDRGAESYDYIMAQEMAAKEPKPNKNDSVRTSLDQDLEDYWQSRNNREPEEDEVDAAKEDRSNAMEVNDDRRNDDRRRRDAIRAGKKRRVKDRLGRRQEQSRPHDGEVEDGHNNHHLDNLSIPQPGVSRNIPDISPDVLKMLQENNSEKEQDSDQDLMDNDADEGEVTVANADRLKASILGEELAAKLSEPKTELMTGVVDIVGHQVALELFRKTRDVEQDGGMMIKNGLRRRTPGGVFLHLLRELAAVGNDPRVDTKKVKKFFAASNNDFRQHGGGHMNRRVRHHNNQNHPTVPENYQSELDAFEKLSKKQKQVKKKDKAPAAGDEDLKPLPDILTFISNQMKSDGKMSPDNHEDEDNRPPDVPPNSVEPVERTLSVYEDDFLSGDADEIDLF